MRVYTLTMMATHLNTADYREPASDCICFNLRKAARAITQVYDEALRPTSLRATQFTILVAIRLKGAMTVSRLAEALVMDRTTLTRNLRPLEKARLVQVLRGEDRREREITLTKGGQAALSKAFPLWRQVQAQVHRRLGSDRVNRLVKDLAGTVAVSQSH